MIKFKLDTNAISGINIPKIDNNCNIYIIPEQCEIALTKYLESNKQFNPEKFRLNSYKVISAMIANRCASKLKITKYSTHVRIQIDAGNFATNGKYFEREFTGLNKITGKPMYEYVFYPKVYKLTKKPMFHYIILDDKNVSDIEDDEPIFINYSYFKNNKMFNETMQKIKLNIPMAIVKSIIYYNEKYSTDYVKTEKSIARAIRQISGWNNKTKVATAGTKVERIYTSIGNLPDIVRSCLHIDNIYSTENDMKASHPTLSVILMDEFGLPYEKDYSENVFNVYSLITEIADGIIATESIYNTDKDRMETYRFDNKSHVKQLTLRSIYANPKAIRRISDKGKVTNNSWTSTIFNYTFPDAWQSLKTISEIDKDVKNIARLSTLEAKIMLNEPPDCYFYPMHDAIGVFNEEEGIKFGNRITEKYKDIVKVVFEPKVFNQKSSIILNDTNKEDKISTKTEQKNKDKYENFLSLHSTGLNIKLISLKLNLSTRTIERYINKFNNNK